MAGTLDPIVYVCVVSDFSLGSLEGCLARRPAHVVLVVSASDRIRQAAKRLENSLQQLLPGIRVHRPDRSMPDPALEGDDMGNAQSWLRHVLLPYLRLPELSGLKHLVNFTGGTKVMTVALTHAGGWHQLDYKGLGSHKLQVMEPDSGGPDAMRQREPLPLRDVPPENVAALYADFIGRDPPNPVENHPESAELAQAIWAAQQVPDNALAMLFDALERIWVAGRNHSEYACKRLTLAENAFLGGATPPDGFYNWIDRCRRLQPEALQYVDGAITLPGNKATGSGKDLGQWISGGWLEQLAHHWLLDAGVPEDAVLRNLRTGADADRSATQREADLFIHHRGVSRVVEIKAGLPPNQAPREMEEQLTSLGARFGRSEKGLLVGPALRRRLEHQNRWEDFSLRCKANSVRLVSTREELTAFILPQNA